MAAAKKNDKADVDYGPGHPNGDHCGVCRFFTPPHSCELVKGEVEAMGWCKLFQRKSKSERRYG